MTLDTKTEWLNKPETEDDMRTLEEMDRNLQKLAESIAELTVAFVTRRVNLECMLECITVLEKRIKALETTPEDTGN